MLKKYGVNSTTCVDSTHGTNAYDIQLTTIMVIDAHREGIPVAFCYSNHVHKEAMEVFFHVVSETAGVTLCDITLMTNDADANANAWASVFGTPQHRLLNEKKLMGDSVLKADVYKSLSVLMEEPNITKFNELQKQFIHACDEDEQVTQLSYFKMNYASRPQVWAYCHRIGLHSHNINLEAMHRVLQQVYLEGREVHRIDKGINCGA